MPDRNASCTALGTAYLRAAHQMFDAQPQILEDPFAVPLLGPAGAQRINDAADSYQTPEGRALRAYGPTLAVRRGSAGRRSSSWGDAVYYPWGGLRYLRAQAAGLGAGVEDT